MNAPASSPLLLAPARPGASLLPAVPAVATVAPLETAEGKRRRQAEARAVRAAARAAARAVVPVCAPEFAHLDLGALRTYRTKLIEEEDRVSYWRRILQARLDTLRDGARAARGEVRHLAPVLAVPRVQGGRTALVTIVPSDDVPPLPDLARLWELTPDPRNPADADAVAELVEGLVVAEMELSAYRSNLHRRLDAATTELIARYRERPTLCLAALPLDLA